MARVLIVSSSYRKESNSRALAQQVVAGAKHAGHTVQLADIGRLRVEPCRACQACVRAGNGKCVIKDDMEQFLPAVLEAEVLVFASPVYWFNLCGQIKNFIDRCYAVGVMHDENGKSPLSRKKIGLVLAHEGEDAFESGGINAIRSIQDICSYAGATWAGALYGCANDEGEAAGNAALLGKALEFGKTL